MSRMAEISLDLIIFPNLESKPRACFLYGLLCKNDAFSTVFGQGLARVAWVGKVGRLALDEGLATWARGAVFFFSTVLEGSFPTRGCALVGRVGTVGAGWHCWLGMALVGRIGTVGAGLHCLAGVANGGESGLLLFLNH